MKTILTTDRLFLREMTQGDLPALAAILQDEQTMYAYNGAFSEAETQTWLTRQLERYQKDGFGLWAVCLKESGDMIGQTGITTQPVEESIVPEIGYLLNRAYWHQGYAAEAAIACKQYAFTVLGIDEIYSIIRETNLPSMNVAIKNGMTVKKRFIKHFRGVDMPHYLFGVKKPTL